MTNAFERLTHPGITSLNPYQPGKSCDQLKRELKINDIIKLASNENPLGCSAQVKPAIEQALEQIAYYPDTNCHNLKQALAEHYSVTPKHLVLASGTDSLIPLIMNTFCLTQAKKVLFPQYSFISYRLHAQILGIEAIEIPSPNFTIDIERIVDSLDSSTRLIFIANPGNPTGNWLNKDEIGYLIDNLPSETLLVMDEAYFEYATDEAFPDTLSLQQNAPNIIITRTFSKAYGLAGLRVGYAIAHPDIADLLNRTLPPFSVNSLAQAAACAALGDQEFVEESVRLTHKGLEQYRDFFNKNAIDYIETTTNFITMDCTEPSRALDQYLLSNGIIVRSLNPYNMPNHLRISIGLPQDNQRVIDALINWRK